MGSGNILILTEQVVRDILERTSDRRASCIQRDEAYGAPFLSVAAHCCISPRWLDGQVNESRSNHDIYQKSNLPFTGSFRATLLRPELSPGLSLLMLWWQPLLVVADCSQG
jgi:hypothetical protein